jgi:hypothetical protein
MIQKTLFTDPVDVGLLREIGDARKQRGMTLAAANRAEAIATGQIAFLRALLGSTDGVGTIDDGTEDLLLSFDRGGKWRGSIPAALSQRGIIQRVGVTKSSRPSRHRGFVSIWKLTDRAKAQSEIYRLTALLSAGSKENPQSAATDAGKNESTNTNSITSNGVNENASQ